MENNTQRRAQLWVPSLYFSSGVPYVIVMMASVVMYTKLGLSKTQISLCTSWLSLPWVIKPIWSPLIDSRRTKRAWIVSMQVCIASGLALTAWAITASHFIAWSLAMLMLMAFASATHDIAADGFYMLSMTQHQQAMWVGLRSTFYRMATVAGTGLLVMLAGKLEDRFHDVSKAWSISLFAVAGLFFAFTLWHGFILPRPSGDGPVGAGRNLMGGFLETFDEFFQKPGLPMAVAFILLYRFDEAQVGKVLQPFLLDKRDHGGLGLTTFQVGYVYGTVGIISLTCGGIVGGVAAARFGLKTMLPIMAAVMYLPKSVFLLLSWKQPKSIPLLCGAVGFEQFGYGFGLTAFLLYMLYFADGPRRTAHYAICTGFMALGMMIPGMWSGWLADHLGYHKFFAWIILCAIPGMTMTLLLKVDPQFGKKKVVRNE